MKKLAIYLLVPLYILTLASCMSSKSDSIRVAMKENKSKVDKKVRCDAEFAVCVTERHMMEIKLSQLAQTNSSSAKVKELANTISEDHTASNIKLKKLAEEEKFSLPSKLSDRSQKVYDRMSKKTGDSFDKAYIHCTVRNHKHDIWEFKKESKKGKDADFKKFAADELPMLQKHLELAKSTCCEAKKK